MGNGLFGTSTVKADVPDQQSTEAFLTTIQNHIDLLENQSLTTVAAMETQGAVVRKIQQINNTGPVQQHHTPAPYPAHRQPDVQIEPLLAQLLDDSQNTGRYQAQSMRKAVVVFKDFAQPVMEQMRTSVLAGHHVREGTGTAGREYSSSKDYHDRYKRELAKEKEMVSKMAKQNKDLQGKLQEMENEKSQLQKQVDYLSREVDTLRQKLDRRQTSQSGSSFTAPYWSSHRSKPVPRNKVSAQLYSSRKSELTDLVIRELTGMLQTQFNMDDTDLEAVHVTSTSDVVETIPVLVVCIISSRLGTDVGNGLRGIQLRGKVACIVLHHQDSQNLPSLPSDRVLTAPEYKAMGAIIDMAFLKDKGVYSCDMNNNALVSLISFIKQHNP